MTVTPKGVAKALFGVDVDEHVSDTEPASEEFVDVSEHLSNVPEPVEPDVGDGYETRPGVTVQMHQWVIEPKHRGQRPSLPWSRVPLVLEPEFTLGAQINYIYTYSSPENNYTREF